MKIAASLLFVFLGLSLNAQSCSEDSLMIRVIGADEVDSSIPTELHKNHVFINNDCPSNGKLLLHLVGSYDNPARTTNFPSLAANNGFKVIVLKYKNNVPATLICKASFDQECYSKFRREVIFGEDLMDQIEVDVNNSIINRLNKLLLHLIENYPAEGWEDILDNIETDDWSDIVLSGHSQGGGHAAFLAKMHVVDRVLMFASPNDYSTIFSGPADWIDNASATPDSNYFAFGNIYDEVVNYTEQFEIWQDMKLTTYADSSLIDESPCNSINTRLLYTTYNVPDDSPTNHSAMIVDNFIPLANGKPVYLPAWEYMLGICSTSTSTFGNLQNDFVLKAFPNPVHDHLIIISSEKIHSIEILNRSAQVIEKILVENQETSINMNAYQGYLFLKVNSESGTFKILNITKI